MRPGHGAMFFMGRKQLFPGCRGVASVEPFSVIITA